MYAWQRLQSFIPGFLKVCAKNLTVVPHAGHFPDAQKLKNKQNFKSNNHSNALVFSDEPGKLFSDDNLLPNSVQYE